MLSSNRTYYKRSGRQASHNNSTNNMTVMIGYTASTTKISWRLTTTCPYHPEGQQFAVFVDGAVWRSSDSPVRKRTVRVDGKYSTSYLNLYGGRSFNRRSSSRVAPRLLDRCVCFRVLFNEQLRPPLHLTGGRRVSASDEEPNQRPAAPARAVLDHPEVCTTPPAPRHCASPCERSFAQTRVPATRNREQPDRFDHLPRQSNCLKCPRLHHIR